MSGTTLGVAVRASGDAEGGDVGIGEGPGGMAAQASGRALGAAAGMEP